MVRCMVFGGMEIAARSNGKGQGRRRPALDAHALWVDIVLVESAESASYLPKFVVISLVNPHLGLEIEYFSQQLVDALVLDLGLLHERGVPALLGSRRALVHLHHPLQVLLLVAQHRLKGPGVGVIAALQLCAHEQPGSSANIQDKKALA